MPIVQLPDGTELDFPDGMSEADMRGAIESNFPQFAAKPAGRTWGQAAADTGAQLGEGVNNIIGAVPNLIAPEGDMAAFFNKSADYWRDQQSDPLKQKINQADTAITAAGEDGMVAQISEAAGQYFTDPALAARFITTNLPSMIPGVGAAKVAQAAALARGATAARAAGIATTAAGGANAVLNAGGARGEAFEDIKNTLVKQGMTPEEAEQQAIADSRIVAAIGGAAGFVSGKTGLEGAIAGKAATGAAVRRGAGAVASELVGEQLEEVTPKLATNYQAGEYDGRDLSKDVGRTMVETAIGSGPGAIIGGVTAARAQPAADLPPINDQPASAADDAVVAPTPTWAEASGAAPAPAPAAPTIADIGAAGSVDEAISAAQAVVASSSSSPHATAAEIDALEAQAGMTAGPRIPINDLDGIDLTAPQVWRQRPATQTWEAANAEAGMGTDDGTSGRGSGAGIVDAPGPLDGIGIGDAGRLPDAGGTAGAAPGTQAVTGDVPAIDAADTQPALSSRDKALAKIARQEEAVRLAAENIAARKAAREAAGQNEDDDWHGFPLDTGTLNIPRDTMPQIKAEHRGALTQFLNARGITHEQVGIPSDQLKPTQAEFSLGKVRKAMAFTGGDRSILVSSDGHVLDGHHQWLAKVEQGEPVKAIRLNAPIRELLETVKEFPSAGVDTASAPGASEQTTAEPTGPLTEVQQKKKSTGGQRARERVKASNPFLAFLASNGVSSEDRSDAGAERGRAGNPMVPGYGPVFRRSGLRFDELALAAQQAGFLTQADIDNENDTGGTRKLADMIARATQNKEVIRQAGSEDQATADERLRAEAEALGLDTNGATPDQLYDMVVSAHAALEEHRSVTGAASVDEQEQVERYADTFTADEAALLLDADIPFDLADPRMGSGANLTDEEIDAIFGIQSAAKPETIGSGKAEKSTAQPARESAAGTESAGDILGSYTREEVVARQDADEARAKARESERARLELDARKKRDKADIDARMDASADNFQLGQSADDALAGQNDLFSAPPPAAADNNTDIPPAFYKKVKVPIEVYIEDEGAYETIEVTADKALASVREDIDNLRALVKCMGGKA